MPEAYVTLATSDPYCMGCLVVGKCLRRHGTTKNLVVMISPSVSTEARLSLENVYDEVIVVDLLDSRDRAHLSLLGRPELGITFTKIHCWTLTQYTKCVFLDADTLVLCNVDELFEREELSASPDPGWPDCFNSGVFVFRPSLETHTRLLEHADMYGSFDGGDQGLLNSFFSDWAVKDINKHLPFLYNLSANAIYTYLPAFHKYGHQAKIVHFLGQSKPWQLPSNQHSLSGADPNRNLEKYLHLWWVEYYSHREAHVPESHEPKDSLLIEPRSQPLVPSHTTIHPQSQVSDLESLRKEEKIPNQSPNLLNQNEPRQSQPLVSSHTTTHPQSQVSGPESLRKEEKIPNQSPDLLNQNEPRASAFHQLEKKQSQPLVSSHTTTHPQSQVSDLESLRKEERIPNQSPDLLNQNEPSSSACHQLEEKAFEVQSDFEIVSAAKSKDLGASEIQESLATLESEVSGAEAAENLSPALTEATVETASVESSRESSEHRRRWEEGHIDYMGRDAFENIRIKLDQFLK
ncbi:glycogenin-2 isoform X2 [Trichomycterus rosablanca]|uniref:glycogenin-2 isoform X2 n=1 Tax=Trichomycterus rosablanca TaxID=2290929 RepID=UPI002F360B07